MKHQIHALINLLRSGMARKEKVMAVAFTSVHVVVVRMAPFHIFQLKDIAGTAITVVVMRNQN